MKSTLCTANQDRNNYFEILKKHGFDILSSNIYVIKGNNPKNRFKYNLIFLAKNTLIK